MPDYSKSILYKLVCLNSDIKDIYVGSTTNFKIRKNDHKFTCNTETRKGYNQYVYQFIRDNGGWNNWTMIKLEDYSCNDKRELEKRENDLLNELGATLNKMSPYKTEEEKNILQKKLKKEWYERNKDKVIEKTKINSRKENYKEIAKKYRQKNVTGVTVLCDCGCEVSKSAISRHKKTQKHINKINNK